MLVHVKVRDAVHTAGGATAATAATAHGGVVESSCLLALRRPLALHGVGYAVQVRVPAGDRVMYG